MGDDNKQDFKKGFSNSFVWFLMAAFLLALMVQNFIDTKFAKVSFSYQLEHLVNLQLVQPEDSRKIALNDNLVTFSGKFRDRLTDEGKNRFKYLELLNANHSFKNDKDRIEKDLSGLREKIDDSAAWYLLISGKAIPKDGFVVVDDYFNTPAQNNSVIINKLPDQKLTNLVDLQSRFSLIRSNPTDTDLKDFGAKLTQLVSNYRSPTLGIGNEHTKLSLKNIDAAIQAANDSTSLSLQNKVAAYEKSLNELQEISTDLARVEDHVSLSKLRSVRNYKEALDEFNQLTTKLEDNQAQLDKARQAVSHVIWFFNSQEVSTRALEKQDPEKFSQWFLNAKEEWDNFNNNRGGVFKAPDQPLNAVLEKTFKS